MYILDNEKYSLLDYIYNLMTDDKNDSISSVKFIDNITCPYEHKIVVYEHIHYHYIYFIFEVNFKNDVIIRIIFDGNDKLHYIINIFKDKNVYNIIDEKTHFNEVNKISHIYIKHNFHYEKDIATKISDSNVEYIMKYILYLKNLFISKIDLSKNNLKRLKEFYNIISSNNCIFYKNCLMIGNYQYKIVDKYEIYFTVYILYPDNTQLYIYQGTKHFIMNLQILRYLTLLTINKINYSYFLMKKYYYKWISIANKPPYGKLYLYDYFLFFGKR